MPHEVVLGPIYTAIKALLAAYAPLTALLGVKTLGGAPAIYDEGGVPQSATSTVGWLPYLTIGAGTQIPEHTIGPASSAKYGWNCTFQIKAVGQIADAAGLAIVSQVAVVLYHDRDVNLAGYGSGWIDEFTVQPTLHTIQAGVTTREWPVIVRVICHD